MGNLHDFVIDTITSEIFLGKYQPGERIPSIREWSHQLGVFVNTMHKAIKYLCDKGIILKGKNSYQVTNRSMDIEEYKLQISQIAINRFLDRMKRMGVSDKEIIYILEQTIKRK